MRITTLLLLMVLLAPASAERFKSAKAGFSVDFPAKPRVSGEVVDEDWGHKRLVYARSSGSHPFSLSVDCIERQYKMPLDEVLFGQVAPKIRDRFMTKPYGWRLVEKKTKNLKSAHGVEATMKLFSAGQGPELEPSSFLTVRVYRRKKRDYILRVEADDDKAWREALRLLDTFKLH